MFEGYTLIKNEYPHVYTFKNCKIEREKEYVSDILHKKYNNDNYIIREYSTRMGLYEINMVELCCKHKIKNIICSNYLYTYHKSNYKTYDCNRKIFENLE